MTGQTGWAVFTTYTGQVCQSGHTIVQEAVALGPCLSFLDQSSGIVIYNFKQLYVASGTQFSIETTNYDPSDTQCSGTQTQVQSDGPFAIASMNKCYNQIFTFGPIDPNAQNFASPTSSTFSFVPGLNGGYNIPRFNYTGLFTVSYSSPCLMTSTPTSVSVILTGICMGTQSSGGSGSSNEYSCNPSWSKSSWQVSNFIGSSNCCIGGGNCISSGSSFPYNHCRTPSSQTNSRYRYQNQTCTNPSWPTSVPTLAPTARPTFTARPTPSPRPTNWHPLMSASCKQNCPVNYVGIIVGPVVSVVTVLVLLWYRRRLWNNQRARAPAAAATHTQHPRDAVFPTNGRDAIFATPAIVNPVNATNATTMTPFQVEAVLVPPRGKTSVQDDGARSSGSMSGVPVVEAHTVEYLDHIPEPSAPPAKE